MAVVETTKAAAPEVNPDVQEGVTDTDDLERIADRLSCSEQKILSQANALFFQKSSPDEEKTPDVAVNAASSSNNANCVYQEITSKKAEYISSNVWPAKRLGKQMRHRASRSSMHGVEIRTLQEPHFLAGETGLFAVNPFAQFDIIGEYCGEITPNGMGLGGIYSAHLDDETGLDALGCNGETKGNESRAINHYENIAEKANVIMKRAYIEGLPRVMIVCKRDIAVGEEFVSCTQNDTLYGI